MADTPGINAANIRRIQKAAQKPTETEGAGTGTGQQASYEGTDNCVNGTANIVG